MASTLKPAILEKYARGCDTFIETGTAKGDGVQVALDYGFKCIYSIEANPQVWEAAVERFVAEPVAILRGDSRAVLREVLSLITGRFCFWLDAHWSSGEADLGPAICKCPVVGDLRAIAEHYRKDHVILVDDTRYFRGAGLPQWDNVLIGDILDVLQDINPNYAFRFEDSDFHNDILVAWVPEAVTS